MFRGQKISSLFNTLISKLPLFRDLVLCLHHYVFETPCTHLYLEHAINPKIESLDDTPLKRLQNKKSTRLSLNQLGCTNLSKSSLVRTMSKNIFSMAVCGIGVQINLSEKTSGQLEFSGCNRLVYSRNLYPFVKGEPTQFFNDCVVISIDAVLTPFLRSSIDFCRAVLVFAILS